MSELAVWREYRGAVERVGSILSVDGRIRFRYDESYEGQPVSASLPLQDEPFSERRTSNFFSALIPEGTARAEFAAMLHAGRDEFAPYLERLNDEPIGALLFSSGEEPPYRNASYEEVEPSFFEELACRPLETAVRTMGMTRLSLSGAMAKVGLFRDAESGRWCYPMGGAPSSHILKAADGKRFPLETVNEALCLGAARRCGLPAASCQLLDCDAGEPLLSIRRFDRVVAGSESRLISGMAAPSRLHQEDFCQAESLALKYEPTDGDYLGLICRSASNHCANAFGERALLAQYTLFHYLVGNCDNHLKNYSLLYDRDWTVREIAPLYDVASTVLYPELYLEMGVSFGGDRRIDHVTKASIDAAARASGLPARMVRSFLNELAHNLPGALEEEADALTHQGFPGARNLLGRIAEGVGSRASAVL